MSILQNSDQRDEVLPIHLHPPQSSICEEFVPFQTAFFRTSYREQRIRLLEPVSEFNEGREVMYGVCLHASICDAGQCEVDPVPIEDTLITVDTVQMSVHGKHIISELTRIGGCYFLGNEEGLIWKEEAGGESGITIRTSNTLFVSSFFALH